MVVGDAFCLVSRSSSYLLGASRRYHASPYSGFGDPPLEGSIASSLEGSIAFGVNLTPNRRLLLSMSIIIMIYYVVKLIPHTSFQPVCHLKFMFDNRQSSLSSKTLRWTQTICQLRWHAGSTMAVGSNSLLAKY